MVRRALALALAALLALPATAFSHATLQSTVPERGAQLDAAPAQVVFKFDEAVEASFGALRVFDSSGQEVQVGKAFHPGGKGSEIAIRLKPGLGDGTYTATFRVVSADGHPVSSGFVFTVGEAAPPSESLDELLAGGGSSGSITNSALSVARGFQYGAIALGLGALIFLLAVWRPWRGLARVHGPARALMLIAAVAGLVSALVAIVLQGAVGEGTSFWSAARPDTFTEVLGTRFGTAWGIGALAWVLVLIVLATRPLRGRDIAPPPAAPEPVLVPAGGAEAPAATAPAPVAVAPRSPRRSSPRSPCRCSASRCCPRWAATRACRNRSRCCCRRTSCTCSRWPRGSAGSPCSCSRCGPPPPNWSRTRGRRCWPASSAASRRWPRSRSRCCCCPASCSRSSRSAAFPHCSTARSAAPC